MSDLRDWPQAVFIKHDRACKNEDEGKEGERVKYIRRDIFNTNMNEYQQSLEKQRNHFDVALALIKQLEKKVEEQQAVIDNLRDENKQNTRTMLELHNKLRRFQE